MYINFSNLFGKNVELECDEYGGTLYVSGGTRPGDPTRGALLNFGLFTYNNVSEKRYIEV